jgi:hypothetical protein
MKRPIQSQQPLRSALQNAVPRGLTRRAFFQATAAATGGCALAAAAESRELASSRSTAAEPGTVLDRLWIFTCAANSDFIHLRRRSVMTPAEGAFFLGVPNIIVVQSSTQEAPHGRLEPPFAQYLVALRPLKRVVWSVVGSGGFHSPEETKEVLELARTTPNFVGLMLDDFFTGAKEGKRAQLTVEDLGVIRRKLRESGRNQEIFVTLYTDKLDLPISDYLELVDVITLWTSDPNHLERLEASLKQVEAIAPHAKRMLGCYLVDYGRKEGTPVPWMQRQCETGLRWLKQRRIEGIIFLGNTTMDLGFASVEWTREWIQKVGSTRL